MGARAEGLSQENSLCRQRAVGPNECKDRGLKKRQRVGSFDEVMKRYNGRDSED